MNTRRGTIPSSRREKSKTVDADFVAARIPPRSRDAHKGMNGSVCVVGGSRIYHGAPFLCASGALRSGVDLVYIAVPAAISGPIRSMSPDFIVIPLPDSKLTRGNVSKLKDWSPRVNCYAIGPGLGPQNQDELANCVNQLKGEGRTLVMDADALRPGILPSLAKTGAVVTPHAGEFERLFSTKLSESLDDRVEQVKSKAKEHDVTVLLKGPVDIVSDGSQVKLNEVHSPAMTVGGTGDVLTGVTAGLLAKGVGAFDAAACAAYISGAAGASAADELGLHIAASDVVNRLANVMKRFDRLE